MWIFEWHRHFDLASFSRSLFQCEELSGTSDDSEVYLGVVSSILNRDNYYLQIFHNSFIPAGCFLVYPVHEASYCKQRKNFCWYIDTIWYERLLY